MPITISDKPIVVEVEDAKFYFEPLTLGDLLDIPGVEADALSDRKTSAKAFLDLLPKKLKKWENVINDKGEALPCTPENFKRLPGGIAVSVITKFTDLTGLSGELEKNSETPST